MPSLAIITTHPIQYNAPWFRLLAERGNVRIKVFYTWSQSEMGKKYDPGFGKRIEWNLPLLEGYDYEFVSNVSKNPGSRSYRGITNPDLIHRIEQFQPDALLVFGWNFKSHLQSLRHFHKKIPVLFRGDSTLLDQLEGIRKWMRKTVLTWVYRNVNHALYVGTRNKEYFLQHGLTENQLVFAPHAIDNNRFHPRAADSERVGALRAQWRVLPTDLVFLFAGKLEPKKDPGILVEAFSKINDFPEAKLVIVGNGDLETALKEKCRRFPNIFFLDFQNQQEMPSIYQAADVVVLPSKGPGETWGLAINEAMASGKPVLVSDRCGCAVDLVDEGKNGYTFPSGNAAELANKIRLFISERDNLHRMGQASLEKIQSWSFEKIAEAVEKIMLNVEC